MVRIWIILILIAATSTKADFPSDDACSFLDDISAKAKAAESKCAFSNTDCYLRCIFLTLEVMDGEGWPVPARIADAYSSAGENALLYQGLLKNYRHCVRKVKSERANTNNCNKLWPVKHCVDEKLLQECGARN